MLWSARWLGCLAHLNIFNFEGNGPAVIKINRLCVLRQKALPISVLPEFSQWIKQVKEWSNFLGFRSILYLKTKFCMIFIRTFVLKGGVNWFLLKCGSMKKFNLTSCHLNLWIVSWNCKMKSIGDGGGGRRSWFCLTW